MIKKTLIRFTASFTITTLFLFLVNVAVRARTDAVIPFLAMTVGIFLISIAVTMSITLFKLEKLHALLSTALGLVPLMAIPLILRSIYGVIIFRFSFVLFVAFAICAVAYAVAVLVVAARYKKEAKDLNDLLK